MDADSFLSQLANNGSHIVSSGSCSAAEIAAAQACGRFYAQESGMGFVLRPKGGGFFLRQDESSHWYLVPADKTELFDNLMYEIEGGDDAACDRFNEMFSDHRLNGGPYDLEIFKE